VWDARKLTFDNILNNLDVLRREVEDEKEQQDRKEGLVEGSDHEDEGQVHGSGQITESETPAAKETDDRMEREGSRDSGEVDEDIRESVLSHTFNESGTRGASVEIEMEQTEEENGEDDDEEDRDQVRLLGADTPMTVD
jgi:hypothetical protein